MERTTVSTINNKRNKTTKRLTTVLVIIVLVVAVAVILLRVIRDGQEEEEDALPSTEIEKLLAKDLDLKYPSTTTEVVKLYWRFNRCMYNEEMTDEEFEELLTQLRKLYDEEFLAEQNNDYDTMLANFTEEKNKAAKAKQTISACIVEENDKVQTEEMDGTEYATLISSALIKVDGEMTKAYEEFMLRRDDEGNWKILGWQESTAAAASAVGVE